jgi:DNA-binding transcriptional MerR regulator
VAEQANVNIQTLRYYERRGLVVAVNRRHTGHREYSQAEVTRVRVIKAAQRLGFTLSEIQELFELSAHHRGTAELRDRAAAKISEIGQRIAQLESMRADLAALITAECGSLTDCSCGFADPSPFDELAVRPGTYLNRNPPPSGSRGSTTRVARPVT